MFKFLNRNGVCRLDKELQQTGKDRKEDVAGSSIIDHQNIDKIPLSVSSDDGKRNQLKVKNAQVGGKKSMKTSSNRKGKHQKNVLVRAEVEEERCESKSKQGIEPLADCQESGEKNLRKDLGAASSNPIPVDTKRGKALFSKYGRRYRPKLYEHYSTQEEMQNNEGLELEVRLPSNSSAKHHRVHIGEKYRCTICGKRFSQKSSLLRHAMVHNRKSPHKCHDCGKNFTWRSSLLIHQVTHKGEKLHQCPECGENFSTRSSLLIHLLIHTGEKSHQCHECGKIFSNRGHLLRHEMVHTGEKPHRCPQCEKSFSQRYQLFSHQRMHIGK